MSNDTLSSLTKSKLSLNSLSLHRWVLLKNSIQHQHHPTEPTPDDDDDYDEEPVAKAAAVVVAAAAAATVAAQAEAEAQAAAFMFPDAGHFLGADDAQMREAQWLDELLESLGEEEDEDDDDDESSDDERPSLNAVEDDVDYTPLVSPMSSLDDLSSSTHHHHHHSPHYNYSFQDDALPYYDAEEEEEDYTMASVPDAIDDTSDDETCSDAPTTPSLGRSSNSFTLPPHPPPGGHPHPLSETRTQHHPHSQPTPPPPLPTTTTAAARTRPRHHPRVYAVDDSDSPIHHPSHPYFYSRQAIDEPWPVDPLPFPLTHAYQQC